MTDPRLSLVESIAAVVMPMATRAELIEIAEQIAPAYELVGGELRPGPDTHALARASTLAPIVVTAITARQAGRASMSPAQKTIADLRARGLSTDMFGDTPDGDDAFHNGIEAHMRATGMLPKDAA